MSFFEAKGIVKNFGGVQALKGASLTINEDEIVSLIGPNGSGKTTFFNCLTGIYTPDEGDIYWAPGNCNLAGKPPHQVARLGIARTFQNIRLFTRMSLLENIMIGGQIHDGLNTFQKIFTTGKAILSEKKREIEALDLLQLFGLSARAFEPAGALSYGLQRRLEIARALAAKPKLLLLDEPCAGLNSHEIDDIIELVLKLRKRGHTILLIEHSMQIVMQISDRIVVFDAGSKIAEGLPHEVQKNNRVLSAYLGDEGHA